MGLPFDRGVRMPLQVMPFFNSVGFQLPERKGIADFLQEVTSPKDQGQLAGTPWDTAERQAVVKLCRSQMC
jgi:hypothetical protein